MSKRKWKLLLAAGLVSLCNAAMGQDPRLQPRHTAIDNSQSRAEQAADELVSLSPDEIISILRKNPGLLLEVKKALVRKAYAQGRLLDPADLTDLALFRLIREDSTIAVLATREIEDRRYVKAKPTQEEMERELEQEYLRPSLQIDRASLAAQQHSSTSPSNSAAPRAVPSRVDSNQEREQPFPPQVPGTPDAPVNDPRRQVQQAEFQEGQEILSTSPKNDAGPMERIRPEDLPSLLNASSMERLPGTTERVPNLPTDSTRGDVDGMNAPRPPALFDNPQGSDRIEPHQRQDTLQQQASLYSPSTGYSQAMSQRQMYPPRRPVPDQPVLRRQANPYADVPSLYDLYSQYGRQSPQLERFGENVFREGTGNFDQLPMDLPVGPEYVVGPGDGLTINVWGSVSQRLQRVVDRSGQLALPEVGTVQVSGHTLGDVQRLVLGALREQYRDVEADVSLGRLRTVRVYVVGDVVRPGAYDVSSLSTPLNAVYTAGGPTEHGSLRILRHYHGKQLVQEIDSYDLLLHGIGGNVRELQAGDTVLVPPLGEEVTVEGMVRRPAIYELAGEKNLAQVLELSGGVMTSGTLRHVDVERIQAHVSRTMLRLDMPENNSSQEVTKALEDFQVQDGDRIKISPILPYADKTVYLDGHVFRPGKFAYRDGMTVTDLVKSYNDLLPEPSKTHAEIIRLSPPDYTPQVIAFKLSDVLENHQELALKPFDTVRVFSRFDFEDPPVVTVTGEVRDPGDHFTNGVMHVRDAIYLAGGVTPDASLDSAQIFRKTADNKLKVISVDLGKALAGNVPDDVALESKDRIVVNRSLLKVDPPTVKIEGEVARPGKYPLGNDMTAADLVRVAGGTKRGAVTDNADLTRYEVAGGNMMETESMTIPIGRALQGEPDTDIRLRDGDVLTIKQLPGWKDIGATITLAGEVVHPGTYGIREGERLSSIIARAGGFSPGAYPYASIFERSQVREIEERNRAELVRTVQNEGNALKLSPEVDGEQKAAKEAALMQWETVMEQLQNSPPSGRMVIHISADMKKWTDTPSDIEVRAGDSLFIPKRPNSVLVDGAVYNSTALTYKPGKNVGWYLKQAGGPTNMANKKALFVIRGDGSVMGGSGGVFTGGVESAALQPGDMVVMPQKAYSSNTRWKNTLQVAQLVSAAGIAIQVARGF
jgi:protein involved in polysaccharide export with SLBB domain